MEAFRWSVKRQIDSYQKNEADMKTTYKNTLKTVIAFLLCTVLCANMAATGIAADEQEANSTEQATTAETEQESQATTLHVKAGGTGDGSSEQSALSDIGDAFEALAQSGGRIVVYGKYELTSSKCHDGTWGAFVEPAHSKMIAVTGKDAFLICGENYRYYMSGATSFENIGFSGSGAFLVAARFNPLCMGEGINIIGFFDGVYLIGGYNGSNSGMTDEPLLSDSSIEVYSGSYKYICGFNRGTAGKQCTGTADIRIYGGNINCIAAGISNNNAAFTSNTMKSMIISVSGGSIYKICDTDMTAFGTLTSLSLDYTGGEIENIIISEQTDACLSFGKEMSEKASEFLKLFDTYKTEDGTKTETRKIKIACVGDNITAGTGTQAPESESYPAKLGEMLGNAYEVKNFSEGGKTMLSSLGSAFTLTQAYKQSLEYQPDAVLIMLGTNDLDVILTDENAQNALYNDTVSLIQSYTALESKPVVYLLTPTQRTDDSALDTALSDILVPIYKQVAEKTQVGYVDIYSISQDMKNHFPDSIHPDAVASAYIATWLYSAVVSNNAVHELDKDASAVEVIIKEEHLPQDTVTDTDDDTVSDDEQSRSSSAQWVIIFIIILIIFEAAIIAIVIVSKKGIGGTLKKGTDTLLKKITRRK